MAKKKQTTGKQSKASPEKMPARRAVSIATNSKRDVDERVAAMASVSSAVCENDDYLQAVLGTLGNQEEPSAVRLAAIQAMQAASFSGVSFESARPDYIATMRRIADDPDHEIRQRVLGILAREQDRTAQKKLLDGLIDPDKSLLPPEKALQLLSYDVHGEAYQVARTIVEKPPSDEARAEALKLLAADASAADVFEGILLDKNESAEARQLSASALQSMDPEKLRTHAKQIVLDESDDADVQATSLTALATFGDAELAEDADLVERVRGLRDDAPAQVKKSARQFLDEYEDEDQDDDEA